MWHFTSFTSIHRNVEVVPTAVEYTKFPRTGHCMKQSFVSCASASEAVKRETSNHLKWLMITMSKHDTRSMQFYTLNKYTDRQQIAVKNSIKCLKMLVNSMSPEQLQCSMASSLWRCIEVIFPKDTPSVPHTWTKSPITFSWVQIWQPWRP